MTKSYLLAGTVASILAFAFFSPAQPGNEKSSADRQQSHSRETAPTAKKITPDLFFKPKKLEPGQKPPQFIVLSFDGVGWHEKWQYWASIGKQVPLRFTGFLTGLYLLDEQHRTAYDAPRHGPGKSSLGAWNTAPEVVQEIRDLNSAWQHGDEIGTHYNGHFCSDNPPGGNSWTTADWNSELDQFFTFFRNYRRIDGLPEAPALQVPASTIRAERTPCLEGDPAQFFPALRAHGIDVDSSVTRRGLSWPLEQNGIWQMGMSTFPLHGTQHFVTTMDYNLWYTQENVSTTVPADRSKQDGEQVLNTYLDMYHAAYQGNRAPLFLGNHFESWNNNAYTTALGNFALKVCGQPDTYCVPFRDVVRWIDAQDPATIARLQSLAPELGPPGSGQ
ncbi:MAG TPA: polysaccharide deacetylase [Mycobacteriales bacterium]|nr:polysaccharide deacetylase [Mycobacteriales bacterium]